MSSLQTEEAKREYEEAVRRELRFWYFVPVIFASAKTGYGVDDVMDSAVRVVEHRRTKIPPRKIMAILER